MTHDPQRGIPPTYLFCPGNRPDRYDKAHSAAPAAVIDLEDAVPPAEKAGARIHALAWLAAGPKATAAPALRINDLFTSDGLEDVHALIYCEGLPANLTILVPKVGHGRELQWLRAQLGPRFPGLRYLALVESVEGLNNIHDIVQRGQPDAIGFGAVDLAAQMSIGGDWESLLFARSQVIAAAAACAIPVLDVPETGVNDEARLREQGARAKALGFTGKFAIHPRQVQPILQTFSPTHAELDTATRIRDAFQAAAGRVCVVDGRMVDIPMYKAAQRLIALAAH